MAYPVLPPKYYLAHFFELLDFLEVNYGLIFEAEQLDFVREFRNLSEDAQCSYVRMVNRKGQVFSRKAYAKYLEITDSEAALDELTSNGFCDAVSAADKSFVIEFLTKPVLQKWLLKSGIEAKTSMAREALLQLAVENGELLQLEVLAAHFEIDDLIVQKRESAMDYLLFLYFGKIQKSLNLYTLRDLGIRKANEMKTKFRPRFSTREDARTEYRLRQCFEELSMLESEGDLFAVFEFCEGLPQLKTSAQQIKDQLLLEIGSRLESMNMEMALKVWASTRPHPAREKQIRNLYKLGRKDETRFLLEEILSQPRSDEELLFAEDFLARKFEKKKIGYLTEILQNSSELVLSDYYFRRPEQGVIDKLKADGVKAEFTENYIWNALFGILFWEELFESEAAAVFNEFERAPADLVGPEFYQQHRMQIEKKLELIQDLEALKAHLTKTVAGVYGKMNDVFQWHPLALDSVLEFATSCLSCAPVKNLALIMRTMAQNFENYHSGYPDLMVHRDGTPGFIEVKAEGDSLRSKQLSKVRLLREAGFSVEVLRVRWQADPNQSYVIVDVETTGGSAQWHRVTEIGAVKVQGGQVVDEFQTLLNPGRPIPKNIIQLTGITNEMVADAPKFADVATKFLEFSEGSIFVAHNVRFDYGFIQREFQRLEIPFVRPLMCTVAGMRKTYPGLASYSLKNLSEHFQISLTQHHRALADARAAAELLHLMNLKRA